MKKNNKIIEVLVVSVALVLLLVGCAEGTESPSTSTRTVRIIGTARKVDSLNRAIGDTYVLDSVDSVKIDGKDISSKLVPADPASIKEGAEKQNNVVFETQVEVPEKITYTAEAKLGYVFDEWDIQEEEGRKLTKEEKKILEEIEDYLEKNNLEHSETITVPASYLSYLVPEYDNGFHVDLDSADDKAHDGSMEKPYSVAEFNALKYSEDEVTLVLGGKNLENLQLLIAHLMEMNDLEEVKIMAKGIEIPNLPPIALEELTLSGITFSGDMALSAKDGEYRFDSCIFKGALKIEGAKEIELKNCTMQDVEISDVAEMEIKNGTAVNITVSSKEVEVVEMKNLTLSGKLDLSAITKGEVELKKVKAGKIAAPVTSDYVVK